MYEMVMEMLTRAITLRIAKLIEREVLDDMALGSDFEWGFKREQSPGGWKLSFLNPHRQGARKVIVTIHTED